MTPQPQSAPNGHRRMQENGADDDGSEGFKREMRDLEEILSKFIPMAKEFVPPSPAAVFESGDGLQQLLMAPPQAAGHFWYDGNGFVIQQFIDSGAQNETLLGGRKMVTPMGDER